MEVLLLQPIQGLVIPVAVAVVVVAAQRLPELRVVQVLL